MAYFDIVISWINNVDWVAWATIVIAIATIFYVCYSKKQWKTMSQQHGTMKDQLERYDKQFHVSHRPWCAIIPDSLEVVEPVSFKSGKIN